MTGEGVFTMSLKDGYIIKEGNNNILSLSVDYPMLKVSSVFSLTNKAPEITYIGQFSDIVEIPLEATGTFSTQAAIHNQGGYLVKIGLIKSGTSESEECLIKMLVKEGTKNEKGEPSNLTIHYQFYRTGKKYTL